MSFILTRLSAVGPFLLPALWDAAVKGMFIIAIVAITTAAKRRSSAASRHLTWFLGMCGLLILPVLSWALPHWDILPDLTLSNRTSTAVQPVMIAAPRLVVETAAPGAPLFPDYTSVEPNIAAPTVARSDGKLVARAAQTHSLLHWRGAVLALWLLGSLMLFGRVVLGFLSLVWLQRGCTSVTDDVLLSLVRDLSSQLGMGGSIDLLLGPERSMPMTWGVFRTRILVPVDFPKWSPEQRRAVLLHELAHAKRRDCITQLIAQIVRAVYWFNPLVWLACSQMESERERACDDLVLSSGARASMYARQLLQIATEMPVVRFGAAAIAMARPSTLEGRVVAILDTKRNRRRVGIRAASMAAVFVCCCAAILATLRAEEIPPELAAIDRWASRYDAKAQFVTSTTLESRLGSGWRDIPFSLDANEEADARECVAVAQSQRVSLNGKTEFSKPETRDELKRILTKRPDYFYAEFLLSIWNRDQGDLKEAERLLDASYRHAPVIVVQRFQFADGSPLAGGVIDSFAIECNRVKKGYLDPSLKLPYFNLRTDADGCIYLPVYNTVYRTNEMSFPQGYSADFAQLGWFETSRKVAVLPAATVSANAGKFVSANDPNDPPTATAMLVDNNRVELLGIGTYSSVAHQWWLPDGSASNSSYDIGASGLDATPTENTRCFIFHFEKSLPGDAHLQIEFSEPDTNYRSYSTVRRQDLGKPFFVFADFPTHPKQLDIRIGETAGLWKTLAEYQLGDQKIIGQLPPGFAVKAVDNPDHFMEFTVSHPLDKRELRVLAIDAGNHSILADNAWFSSDGITKDDQYRFKKLRVADVRRFRVEAREYQWAEFKNIAIEPQRNGSAVSKPGDGGASARSEIPRMGKDTQLLPPFFTIAPTKTVQRSTEFLPIQQSLASKVDDDGGTYSLLKHPADAIVIPPTPGIAYTGYLVNVDLDHTVTYTATYKTAGKPDSTWKVSLADGRDRMEWPNGMVLIHNTLEKQSLFLNPTNKTAVIATMIDVSPKLFQVANIEKMADPGGRPVESLGHKMIGGKDAEGIRWKLGSETRTLWRDGTTHQPIQIETDLGPTPHMAEPMHVTYSDIVFDEHLDDKLFAIRVPAGYEELKGASMKIEEIVEGMPVGDGPATQPARR